MTPNSKPKAFHHLPVVLVGLLVTFGCGERSYILDPGSLDAMTGELSACFDGAQAELTRFSTACSRSSAKSLSSEVADGREFPAEIVATLDAPCDSGPTPAIDVSIERNALVFDFANEERGGRFSRADFDGYVIDLDLTRENALLVWARVDPQRTTLAVDDGDISIEPDHIEVNLEGVAYEPGSMLEIELWFLDVAALDDDA
jgi:hypothetical protein